VESSRSTSYEPTWSRRGGRPRRSASRGLARGEPASAPLRQVGLGVLPDVRGVEDRVEALLGGEARARQRQVEPAGERDHAGGQREPRVSGGQQRRQGEAASGRVAREDHARRVGAAEQRSVRGQCVVDGRWERVLGSDPVVEGQRAQARAVGERRSEGHAGAGGPDHVAAAVQVEQHTGVVVGRGQADLQRRDATEGGLRDAGAVRYR
jgi:hypothetical protein